MFRLYELNGELKEFPKGVIPLDITISSIQRERNTETIENVPGVIDYGSRDSDRSINLKLFFRINKSSDYGLLIDKVNQFFKGHFYVEENRLSGRVYKVTVPGSFRPERYDRNRLAGEFDIPCEISKLPYAESKTPLEVSDTGNEFTIYSDGSQVIEPYHQFLEVELSTIQGSSSFVELENTTNGTKFRITEGLNSSAIVLINGVQVRINGGQALRRTTRKFISLDPGMNQIKLNGATSASLKIRYKNYYS